KNNRYGAAINKKVRTITTAPAARVVTLIGSRWRDFIVKSRYQLHPKLSTRSESARTYHLCSAANAGVRAARLPELMTKCLKDSTRSQNLHQKSAIATTFAIRRVSASVRIGIACRLPTSLPYRAITRSRECASGLNAASARHN